MRSAAGSITRLGKDHYRIRVTAKNGERLSRNIRGSRVEAERTKATLLMEGGYKGQDITLSSLIEDIYLPDIKGTVREYTYLGYERYAKMIAESELGTWPISSLPSHTRDIEAWLASLPTAGGAGFAYKVLRQALSHARKRRHIPVELVTDMIDQPRTEPPEKPTVTLATMRDYLACCEGDVIYPGIVISLAVGTRRCETSALDWSDIAWERGDGWWGRFRVTRGLHERSDGSTYTEPPKSRASERDVFLPEWAGEVIHPLRGDGPLMLLDGQRLRPNSFSRRWMRCQRRADLPPVPLRNLRHSCATILIRELGVPVADVQQLLGHSSSAVTEGFYLQQDAAPLVRTSSAWGLRTF